MAPALGLMGGLGAAADLTSYAQAGPPILTSQGASPLMDATPDGRMLIVSADPTAPGVDGYVRIFERVDASWVEATSIEPEGFRSRYGAALAISDDGSTIVTSNGVNLEVFTHESGGWSSRGVYFAAPDASAAQFIDRVAVSADGGVIAAVEVAQGGSSSRVAVLKRDGAGWSRAAGLPAPPGAGVYGFGTSLDLDAAGTSLIVGAAMFQAPGAAGLVSIYAETPGGWTEAAEIGPDSAAGPRERLGISAAISGDGSTVLVGGAAVGEGGGTRTLVYSRTPDGWQRSGVLDVPAEWQVRDLDTAVDVNHDGTVAVATTRTAWINNPYERQGAAVVFRRTEAGWVPDPRASHSRLPTLDRFGIAVALSGGGFVVADGGGDGGAQDGPSGVYTFLPEQGFGVVVGPFPQAATVGRSANFFAVADAPGLAATWLVSDDGGASWHQAAGEVRTSSAGGSTVSTLSFTASLGDDGDHVRVEFVDPATGASRAGLPAQILASRETPEVSMTFDAYPMRVGTATTVTVRVSPRIPGLPTPGGSVRLEFPGPLPWRPDISAVLVDGVATLIIPGDLVPGFQTVRAVYPGDENTNPEAVERILAVEKNPSILTAEVPAKVAAGQDAAITAELKTTEPGGRPAGGVIFLDGGVPIAFVQLREVGGRFLASTNVRLTAGDHYFQFVYLGDPRTASSASGVYRTSAEQGGSPVPPTLAIPLAGTVPAAPGPRALEAAPDALPSLPDGPATTAALPGERFILTLPDGSSHDSVQWQSSDDGTTWTDIEGANAPWLRLEAQFAESGRRYRARDAGGSGWEAEPTTVLVVRPRPILRTTVVGGPRGAGEGVSIRVDFDPPSAIDDAAPQGLAITVGGVEKRASATRGGVSVPFDEYRDRPGSYATTVVFEGDERLAPARSSDRLAIGRRASSIEAVATRGVDGAAELRVTVRVADGSRPITGGVMFLDGGRPFALVPLAAAGDGSAEAVFRTAGLAPGMHYFQFVYLGDPLTQAAASGVTTWNVPTTPSRASASPGAAASSASMISEVSTATSAANPANHPASFSHTSAETPGPARAPAAAGLPRAQAWPAGPAARGRWATRPAQAAGDTPKASRYFDFG